MPGSWPNLSYMASTNSIPTVVMDVWSKMELILNVDTECGQKGKRAEQIFANFTWTSFMDELIIRVSKFTVHGNWRLLQSNTLLTTNVTDTDSFDCVGDDVSNDTVHFCKRYVKIYLTTKHFSGADPGGALGSDEHPQRQRNFLEALLVGRGWIWWGEPSMVTWKGGKGRLG